MSGGGDASAALWFKHDLRIDDHPGLHHALSRPGGIVPLFCFDPGHQNLLRTPHGIEGLVGAVAALRESLQRLGSTLVVRCGSLQQVLPAVVQQFNAGEVVTEEETEYRWHRSVDQVAAALPADVTFTQWRLQIYTHTPYPSDYKQFRQKRGGVLAPLPAPEALGGMPQPAVQQQ
eukprot:jgi/Astpho2/3213/Aster-x0568